MHPVWQFTIIIITILVSGIFGGLKIRDYIEKRDEKDSVQHLVKGLLFIAGGLLVSIGTFLVTNPSGRTSATVPKNGAFERNEKAEPELSKKELEEDSKKKKTEEWGEVNNKSYEEIREESNKVLEDAINRNKQ